jgi:hypothetical protein
MGSAEETVEEILAEEDDPTFLQTAVATGTPLQSQQSIAPLAVNFTSGFRDVCSEKVCNYGNTNPPILT